MPLSATVIATAPSLRMRLVIFTIVAFECLRTFVSSSRNGSKHHLVDGRLELHVCRDDKQAAIDAAAGPELVAQIAHAHEQRDRPRRVAREIANDLLKMLDGGLRQVAELDHPRLPIRGALGAEPREVRGAQLERHELLQGAIVQALRERLLE